MKEKRPAIADEELALDEFGCLQNFYDWTLEFAESMAEEVGIAPPLTEAHKKIINYIRETVIRSGRTPIVHSACGDNGLKLWELERLFPAGYHRGACKLAGLNYRDSHITREPHSHKVYCIDAHGFLIDANEWDETFAAMRAEELGTALTEEHWRVIRFLRKAYTANGKVPTVFETYHGCNLGDGDLEQLFPSGYHRGAVKIAGLTVSR